MKNNELERDYRAYREIEVRYFDAYDAGNEEAAEAARAEVIALNQSIDEKGEDYANFFRDYRDARDRENETIDLHDAIWDEQVPALIERMKKFGVERFTFSSTWSGSVQTAWLFLQNGCTLEGMTQINGTDQDWKTGEYNKVPAYVFSIN